MASSRLRGTIYCILSGALFGLMGFAATKLYAQHFSIENTLFWRFFIAAIYMGLVQLYIRLRHPGRHIRFATIIRMMATVSIVYSISTLSYFTSASYIGTGVAMVLFFIFPVFIAFYQWLNDRWILNLHGVTALLAVVFGVLLLRGYGGHALNNKGVLLSLNAAFFYATYILMNRKQTKLFGSTTLTFYTCLGASLCFCILSLSRHSLMLPPSFSAWFYALFLGVIATALPIQLLLAGLRHVSSTKASVLSVFEPIVMMIMGVAFLGEHITFLQCVGIFVMLAGAILIQFEKVSEEKVSVTV